MTTRQKARSLVAIGIVVVAVALLLWFARVTGFALFINETPSEPIGVYRLVRHDKTDYRRNMYVIFPVPEEFRGLVYGRGWMRRGNPFLKELLGMPGDEVCVSDTELRINGQLIGPVFAKDSLGLALPKRRGCFVVAEGTFFAASRHLPNNFDGRYFGPLPMSTLIGEATPVWIF